MKKKAEKYLYFGLTAKSGYENSVADKWWEFDVSCFGHRAIMNDVTATMALEQYKKLPVYMEKRAHVHAYYDEHLRDLPWIDLPLPIPAENTTSYYFYHIQITNGLRDQLAKYLRERGIYTTYRYFPLHRVPGYGVTEGSFPNADYAADHTLCLPLHQSLTDEELALIVDTIHEFGAKFC